jgi:hypothetical protein
MHIVIKCVVADDFAGIHRIGTCVMSQNASLLSLADDPAKV